MCNMGGGGSGRGAKVQGTATRDIHKKKAKTENSRAHTHAAFASLHSLNKEMKTV